MADMGLFKTDDQGTEFRQSQPLRHLAAQYAALGFGSDFAFSGDNQHETQAVAVRAMQEARELPVGPRLRHAVQIEAGVDLFFSA